MANLRALTRFGAVVSRIAGERMFAITFTVLLASTVWLVTSQLPLSNNLTSRVLAQQIDANASQASLLNRPAIEASPVSIKPMLNQNFITQGLISSSPSVLPDRNDTQTAMVLIPRDDGAFYSGVLTYQSTRPVEPVVWNVVSLTNATSVIPEEFGESEGDIFSLVDVNSGRTAQVVLSSLEDEDTSGSIPFTGDAIELVGDPGEINEPFIVSYSLTAFPSIPTMVNDLRTISNFTETIQSEDVDEDTGG